MYIILGCQRRQNVCVSVLLTQKTWALPGRPAGGAAARLTVSDLQLGFSQDASGHGQGLADVEAGIGALHAGDGEVAAGRHGEAAVRVLGLVGKEQVLEGRGQRNSRVGGVGSAAESVLPPSRAAHAQELSVKQTHTDSAPADHHGRWQ